MNIKRDKYIFTQLSAPCVGFASVLLILFLCKNRFPEFFIELSFLKVSIILLVFIFVLMGSMALWGRVLVFMGILTKNEARGYPYSKSWETKKLS